MAYAPQPVYPAQRKQIDADLKTETFRPLYLLYGEEAYLVRHYKRSLRDALLDGADRMNLLEVTGEKTDPEEMIAFAETMPFFAKRRVVIAEQTGFFKRGCAVLEEYLKEPPENCVFVFVESVAPDKRSGMYKRVASAGRELNCEVQSPSTLKAWAMQMLGKQNGRVFKESTLDYLLERTGTDMFRIEAECNKLIDYTAGRKEITKKDIDAVCVPFLTGKVFELTDAMADRNRDAAMRCYVTLKELSEEPNRLLFLIERQFYLIYKVLEMDRRHASDQVVASSCGISPKIVFKYRAWARRFHEEELKEALDLCLTNERALKRSLLDKDIALEMIIASCTKAQAKAQK